MPYTTINENRVFYRKSKKTNNTKKTIIFIHGSGGDGFVWEYQLNGLSEFITVIIPDLPGHGKSEGLCFGSAKDYAGWINDFAESLNLSSFYLAGHSLGGAVAQEFATIYPEKTEGLILVGTGFCFDISKEYMELLQTDFKTAINISCERAFAGKVSEELYKKGYEMLLENGRNTLYKDMVVCESFDGSEFLLSKNPSLILCGQEDRITNPKLSRQLSKHIDKSTLHVVPEAGHMVMIEAPEITNRAIENFVISERV
jgi:pimeloyl-ACP methyl ester carboxylesterase